MGFKTFRGDNRTFAVIILAPAADRELRVLRYEDVWTAARATIQPLDLMTSPEYGQAITGVLPMDGLLNVDRSGDPGATAATRCSPSPRRSPPRRTTTWSCGAPSVASACWIAPGSAPHLAG